MRSSAVPDDNVEVQAALAAGIPVLKRAQFLGRLMENHLGIAVAGTHGKTTTTAMIAWLLTCLGQDPSYIIGGTAKNLGGRNAHAGKGPAFVIEADEYDRMFLGLNPDVIVVTYLEHDHPDCFPTPQVYYQAFVEFIHQLQPGGMLLLANDNAAALPPGRRRSPGCIHPDLRNRTICQLYSRKPELQCDTADTITTPSGMPLAGEKFALAQVSLQVPGEHNVRNSLAALAVIHRFVLLGDTPEMLTKAAQALAEFTGTGRRFDLLGEAGGVTVIDDYAHHPTEIQATLSAARARYPGRRIWAVWQPHTYSRTRALLSNFANSFAGADHVIVTEIYAAREKAQDFDNFSAAQVLDGMSHPSAQLIPSLEAISAYLLQQLRPGDVLLVLSAGDADQVSARVLSGLRERKGSNA